MKSLRRASTRHLLTLFVAVAAAAGGATAIAFAATGGGPTPPPKPLADAVHDALAAPQVEGVTARVRFTNSLIDASSLRGEGNALLAGATGRLWASADGRMRLELQSTAGDAQVVADKKSFRIYDASSNTLYEGAIPNKDQQADQVPSVTTIQDELANLTKQFAVSDAQPSTVAGRPAYTVHIAPRHDGGLLGAGELAWDSQTGTPLRVAIYAQGQSSPTLELAATDVTYGPVDSAALDVPAPAGAKVTRIDTSGVGQGGHDHGAGKTDPQTTGVADVQKALPFTLSAPDTLAGLPRKGVHLLHIGDTPSALVTYGQGLGGIAVIESASKGGAATGGPHPGGLGGNLSLPKLSISGATGSELATALGTFVQFERGGVSYVVAGAVPAAAAEAAARGL